MSGRAGKTMGRYIEDRVRTAPMTSAVFDSPYPVVLDLVDRPVLVVGAGPAHQETASERKLNWDALAASVSDSECAT